MTPCSGNLRDTSSLGWGFLSGFGLVVAVGIDGEDPDEGVTVVDVDEVFDFDDTDPGTGVTGPDLDEFASKSDAASGADLPHERMRRVDGFGHLVDAGELDHVRWYGCGAVPLGGGHAPADGLQVAHMCCDFRGSLQHLSARVRCLVVEVCGASVDRVGEG